LYLGELDTVFRLKEDCVDVLDWDMLSRSFRHYVGSKYAASMFLKQSWIRVFTFCVLGTVFCLKNTVS
jgi:hypothetical protein